MAKIKDPILEAERRAAWTGDAVLSLFARRFILDYTDGYMDGEMLTRMTSNQFLAAFGNPTRVEAEIGRLYESEGLDAAFAHLEERLVPLFKKQEAKRNKRLKDRGR